MERIVNRNNTYIRQKLDKNKPFFCNMNGINYKLLLKSTFAPSGPLEEAKRARAAA